MNFSNNLFRYFFGVIFLIGFQISYAQSNFLEDEKYSVGVGIGWEYGIMGLTGKYFPLDDVGITATVGGPLAYWNVGLEANIPYVSKERLVPYVTIRYGINSRVDLYSYPDPFLAPTNIEKRSFNGFAYGAGFKYKFKQDLPRYLTVSINYISRSSSANEFIEEYNLENGTNFESNYNSFIRPSIGIVFYFN